MLALLVIIAALMSQPGEYQVRPPDWLNASDEIRRLEQQTIAALFTAAASADGDLTDRIGEGSWR